MTEQVNRSVIEVTLNKIGKTERHQWQNVQVLSYETTSNSLLNNLQYEKQNFWKLMKIDILLVEFN